MKRLIALVAVASAVSFSVNAGTLPQDVKFAADGSVAQSLTGTPGDPAEGLRIATTRSMGNCIACHVAQGWAKFPEPGNIGPSLDGAGARYTVAQLRGIIANPKHTFAGTMMPSFYNVSNIIRPGEGYTAKPAKVITPILTAQQVEDVVAFIATFKN
ncbi:MAG: sulfur oxidation c-type cytochrome SoxX [Paracoccaceae bacterium]|nr:sulfur oxidation c-type cytochrome SoxX [Paracoccaceae bacterium]MDE3123218.1 sulfur oxidation c-type cytochrome SoxX [Paracoccaceae bacterium]MDE3240845.1 sulfur oxidation c-type cytochrome SoxX [Paracoccaceae bacterium]